MKDTTFHLSPEQLSRLVEPYGMSARTGAWEPRPVPVVTGGRTSQSRPPRAADGLFSTAGDIARFCEILLNDGVYAARVYLRQESVLLMRRVQTAGIGGVLAPLEGHAGGLGCVVVEEPMGPAEALAEGTFGHRGEFGMHAWMDPIRGAVMVLMVQRADFQTPDANPLLPVFQQAVVDSLDR